MKQAGKKLLENLADLLKVKTILSLSVIITVCILTFKGIIDVGAFMAISGSIITYYFTKKDNTSENIKNEEDK